MNKKITALLIAIAFVGMGCGIISTQSTTRGHNIASSDVKGIVKGQTTEREILKTFGPPTKVRDTDTGKELLYEYAKSGGLRWNLGVSIGGGTSVKTLLIWLNKQGVVEDYAFKN